MTAPWRSRAGRVADFAASAALRLHSLRGRGLVVVYHRVSPLPDPVYPPVPPLLFEAHLDALKRDFSLLPLWEFVKRFRDRRSLRRCCSVTFDDGYRDFLDHAYPILRREGVHATHFLASDSLLTGRPTWNWRLNRITLLKAKTSFDPALKARVAGMTALDREAYLAGLECGDTSQYPNPALLGPDDLGRFDPAGVEWGSHSVTHSNLGECDSESARRELAESRDAIEGLTGRPVRFFSYPNGSSSPEAMRLAEQCGYEAAFATGQRGVLTRSPLFALPRFDVAGVSTPRMRLEVGGVIDVLRGVRSRFRPRQSGTVL